MARVLIVEDEAIIAMTVKMELEQMGHVVVGIADEGETAVEAAAKEWPEIILMDITLKGDMSGIEATGLIGERYDCHIIYMTANADPTTLDRAKRTRHSGFIHKPFETGQLQSVIDRALRGRA